MLGKIPWNKGITAKDDARIEASRSKISKSLLGHSHAQSQLTREKISSTMKRNKCGGLRKGSGRGRKGYYNKIWCDSTWELAYVLYNIDHGIKFKRNKKGFEYVYKNKTHRYYPDFVLPDNTYIEIKGYYTKQTISKMNQFSKIHKLIVLDKVGIQPYLDYAVDKYGKEFYNLYNKN